MNRFKENSGKDNLVRYKFFKNSDGDIAWNSGTCKK